MASFPHRTVLFVDDEQRILDAVKRALRPMRDEWRMEFASSGAEALSRMATTRVDVVVSDMRMPGMDGATLLIEVMKLYPQTVRIVLSGYSDQETVLRSVGIAHQYLSKPCDPELVRRVIDRTCNLRDHLSNEALRGLVSEMTNLPSMPALYQELLDEVRSPLSSNRRLGEIISKDIAMTAKVLQIVNSAFFGLARRVSSAVDALNLLGQETVMSLALTSRIFTECAVTVVGDQPIAAFWSESIAVGTLARAIAACECTDRQVAQEAFTAGMLHDVGRLVLASQFPGRYPRRQDVVRLYGGNLVDAERAEFGAAHPEVGAYLLGLWGLPDSIVEAVAFHHAPGAASDGAFGALTAVHAAQWLRDGTRDCPVGTSLDDNYLAALGVADGSARWRTLVNDISGPGSADRGETFV